MQTLHSDRLLLRAFAETDAEDIFAWAGDARVTKFLSFRPHESLAETKQVLAGWISEYANEDHYSWAIEFDGKVIGRIHTNYVSRRHKRCEIGCHVGYDYWNMGLVSEALRCVLDYFFSQDIFNRVEAIYEPENPASGRVMEKCGMQCEGTLRQFFLCRDNTYADALLYAILKESFK